MSSAKIDLSIIIPLYNGEKYINRCITSIQNQGIDPDKFEVLIIDDGSTDNSITLVSDLVEKYANITLYQQENNGPGAARNKGILLAQGDFIYCIDCDDYLIEQSLNHILLLAQKNNLDILGFDSKITTEIKTDNKQIEIPTEIKNEIKNGCDFIANHNYQNEVWWYIIRKNFLEDSGLLFPEGRMLEDVCFTAKLLLNAKKIGYLPVKIHRYFRHPESILSNNEKTHYNKLINDFELAIHDYNEVLTKASSMSCSEKTVQRIKTRQQSFVFFLISRLYKSDASFSKLIESLKRLRTINAYPINSLIGEDYNSFNIKILTKIYNNKFLLWVSFRLYRLLRNKP